MNISFDFDINLEAWAKAIGYKIEGDKLVRTMKLSDFEEAVQEYVRAQLESGMNSNVIVENFFANDINEFKSDFEYEYKAEV